MDITEKVEESCGSSVVVLMFSRKLWLKVFLLVYDVVCFLLYCLDPGYGGCLLPGLPNILWKVKNFHEVLWVLQMERGLAIKKIHSPIDNCKTPNVINIARTAKAALHNLPGKSSSNVSFVIPVFPVCPAHDHHDHHNYHDRHDHGDRDDHGDHDNHGDHEEVGSYMRKLEVVWSHIK